MPDNFNRLVEIMRRLRAPGGCPWDAEQTHTSLAPYLIEETYEVFDAISEAAAGEPEHLREELGDLLLQIVFHAQIAEENGDFTIDDVAAGVAEKMILRHPHVFADKKLETADDVLRNWDALKAAERLATGKTEKPKDSLLDDVSNAFPALLEAQKVGRKAAKVGFDWETVDPVFEKINEEVQELQTAVGEHKNGDVQSKQAVEEELGDLLFAVTNLARHLDVDAETALRRATLKFRRRFAFVEKELRKQNRTPNDASLTEMDELWNQAKSDEQ